MDEWIMYTGIRLTRFLCVHVSTISQTSSKPGQGSFNWDTKVHINVIKKNCSIRWNISHYTQPILHSLSVVFVVLTKNTTFNIYFQPPLNLWWSITTLHPQIKLGSSLQFTSELYLFMFVCACVPGIALHLGTPALEIQGSLYAPGHLEESRHLLLILATRRRKSTSAVHAPHGYWQYNPPLPPAPPPPLQSSIHANIYFLGQSYTVRWTSSIMPGPR